MLKKAMLIKFCADGLNLAFTVKKKILGGKRYLPSPKLAKFSHTIYFRKRIILSLPETFFFFSFPVTACGSAELHNKYRRFHKSTPDVDGSNELVTLSQQCASQIIQSDKSTCEHDDSYGVNIAILPSVSRTSHLEELMAAW